MIRPPLLRPGVVVLVAVASLAACSGSAGEGIGDSDAGTVVAPSDGSAPDARTDSSAGFDAAVDAGLVVTEKPAPDCNDLPQRADAVQATATLAAAPTPVPITTIAPGLYIVKAITDYGGPQPVSNTASQTTVFFTATKEYYLRDETGVHQVFTLDWTISGGKLVRNILCGPAGTPAPASYRIGASTNGFTVFVDGLAPGNRTEAVRYESAQ